MAALVDLGLPEARLASSASRRTPGAPGADGRTAVDGKFLAAGRGRERFFVRGITYGAFKPDPDGREYPDDRVVDRDFAAMAQLGINTVRIPHTMPPRSLLDTAQRHGLKVMAGLSAEQWVGYLIDGDLPRDFEERSRAAVRCCAGHPALLCYALGNEIPASQLRWLGCRRVAAYLRRLYRICKEEDPRALVTHVNYPTTEYLDLPFLDIVSFNVYLENPEQLRAYLARLQNIAGNRPLLLTELGLDSLRNGEPTQAQSLDWQIRTTFAAGAAGVIVFAWTDEWFRAGAQVEDWAFGITDVERRPKPAARAVQRAFSETPFRSDIEWPPISVVVCSYNGARTIRQCLDGLMALDYPEYEVIVVDDGSTDDTAAIAGEYPFTLISQANAGLSAARNAGLAAASGAIVAYIDDDAFPDRDWLRYLAAAFADGQHVAAGGPNVQPPGDGLVSECVAHAPGGPSHVLLSDQVAEHIPGCNMAFRKDALLAIGGFDPRFRAAGDDVDICWRLQDRGGTIGFSPAALVWHHRRNSVRAFWKQQVGYGKAEAQLAAKWPQRYNALGHAVWAGRIYGHGSAFDVLRQRIYYGIWGTAPFQPLHQRDASVALALMLAPECYILMTMLAGLGLAGFLWAPLWWAWVLPGGQLLAHLAEALLSASRAPILYRCASRRERFRYGALLAFLHGMQPIARLVGRLRRGLTPWRSLVGACRARIPWPNSMTAWTGSESESWRDPPAWVRAVRDRIASLGARVDSGGPYDRWDLEVAGGPLACARLLVAVEDHGAGSQYIRIGMWPRVSSGGLAAIGLLLSIAALAALGGAWTAGMLFTLLSALLIGRLLLESGRAMGILAQAAENLAASWGNAVH